MSWWSRLFPCRGCEAKEKELERLERRVTYFEGQLDLTQKRLVEIADPRAEERVAQAERLRAKPLNSPSRSPRAGPLLPGTEPAPPPDWEVDGDS